MGRPRRRRRSGHASLLLLLLFLGTGAVGVGLWYAYSLLSQDLRDRIASLEDQTAATGRALEESERARGALSVALEESRARLRYIETRYERDVPTGEARRLQDLVERMLEADVPPDRLAFLIRSAGQTPECAPTPETRQTPVALPGQPGSGGVVTFADRRITATAEGTPATDDRDRPEAWFDPTAPVTVNFSRVGGQTDTAEGVLPLHHTMLLDGQEYRLTVTTSSRPGLIDITALACALPRN